MAEPPPAKRAKRESSSAMWDKHDNARGTTSPRPHDSSVNGTHKRDDDRRRRSRSPRERERDRDKYDRSSRHERSRSRDRGSNYRDRDRNRDRDRGGRDRERSRSRDRDRPNKRPRSRSPLRNGIATRQRSPPPTRDSRTTDHDRTGRVKHEPRDARPVKQEPGGGGSKLNGEGIERDSMDVDMDDEDAVLKRVMGFSSFKTTQNTKVPGNQIYGVRKEKKTEYRQYMNRVGGFNRPLSPGR